MRALFIIESKPQKYNINLVIFTHKLRHKLIIKMYKVITFDSKGPHKIGGIPTSSFNIPKSKFEGGIQYIGKISTQDPNFDWLPFDLELISPIYSNFSRFYVDYTDKENPLVLPLNDKEEFTTEYTGLTESMKTTFEERSFSFTPQEEITEDDSYDLLGVSVNPYWGIQDSLDIYCPKSKDIMNFVCQLSSWTETNVEKCSTDLETSDYSEELSTLNFWGDSHLRVYFNPATKIACYFIMGT